MGKLQMLGIDVASIYILKWILFKSMQYKSKPVLVYLKVPYRYIRV